ncbi:RDD family protein [Flavobacterium hydrophilum]|uniref:RDD family protein n=1 Tax=Flavobacterium hydrophilum TaxID=2211445 RepID=A0A2V4CNF9_9FLAO|nr:RDD family protein [Flavobacterium hydrophilum]PXY47174.1 RDD family protein [Flavobacterium hydrophilum]
MNEKYPFVLERIQSILIDSVLIIACMIIFSDILSNFKNVPDWLRAILLIALFLYEPIMTTFGGTIGNNIKKIRVRKNSNENESINIFQALVRYTFKLLFGWLSFISIFSSTKKRAIHDILSGTVMIKV